MRYLRWYQKSGMGKTPASMVFLLGRGWRTFPQAIAPIKSPDLSGVEGRHAGQMMETTKGPSEGWAG